MREEEKSEGRSMNEGRKEVVLMIIIGGQNRT